MFLISLIFCFIICLSEAVASVSSVFYNSPLSIYNFFQGAVRGETYFTRNNTRFVLTAAQAAAAAAAAGAAPPLPATTSNSEASRSISTATLQATGISADFSSAFDGVLAKDPVLNSVFNSLTGDALKEAVQQTQPQGNSPSSVVSAGAMSTSQGNVSGQQESVRADFRETQKSYAGYSSLQLVNLQKLKEDNNSSQFKYWEFFSQSTKNPNLPNIHGYDEQTERPLLFNARVKGNRVNLWVQNNTQLHNTSNYNGFTGMHSFTKGGTTGIDYRFTDKFLIGFMGGGAFTNYNMRLNQGTGEVKSVFTGFYTSTTLPKDFYVDTSFVVGRNNYKNNRNINIPGLSLIANESHKGTDLSGRIKIGTLFNLHKTEVSPYVGIGYLRSMENGYTETNAGSLNLSVLSKRNQFLQAETGVKVSKDFLVDGIAWNPSASIGLSRDQTYNVKSKVTSFFVGEGNGFVVDGNNSKRNQIATNYSLAVVFPSGTYINAGYNLKFNRNEQTHEAVIRIGKKF